MILHASLHAAAPCALLLLFLASPALPAADLLRMTPAQMRSAGVESAAVVPRRGGPTQGLPAQVVIPAPQIRLLSAPLAGLVESVTVATSQSVRRGQVLARLASPGLADLQHTYLQASAQHQVAASVLARDEKLLTEGIIAQSRLEAARGRRDEIAADLAERTQALKAAGMSADAIARLRAGRGLGTGIDLVAPIDGVVLEQMAVPGQRLEAAAPVMKLAKLDPLWLEIQVPVDRMGGIEIGSEARVAGVEAVARVIAIGRAVAAGTQTVAVRAEVRKGSERLHAGQLVEAVIGAGGGAGWVVPAGAVARVGGRAQVYVEQAGGFAVRQVRVLQEAGGDVVVEAPFNGNERVAVRGVATLKAIEAGIGGVQ